MSGLSLRAHAFRAVIKYGIAPRFHPTASIQDQRSLLDNLGKLSLLPFRTKTQSVTIDDVPGKWITATAASEDRAILYFHGGGYNLGSSSSHGEIAAHISKTSGARVLLIDYRCAPEHPYPGALEDGLSAYRGLLEMGFSPQNIGVLGDSAGSGLTIATLVSLRDAGKPLPALAVCLSPWVDLELSGESVKNRLQSDPFLNADWLRQMALNYIGTNDPRSPFISPIYADLHDLPPLFVQVGTDDILYSDAERLVERAQEAGMETTFDVWENMWHVWHFFVGKMPEANRAIKKVGSFFHKHMG